MRRLGVLMSDGMIQRAADLDDQFQFLSQTIETRFQQAVLTAAGAADGTAESFEKAGDRIGDFFDVIARGIGNGYLENLAVGLLGLAVAGPIGGIIGALLPELRQLWDVGQASADGANAARTALELLHDEMADTGPLTLEYIQNSIARAEADLAEAEAARSLANIRALALSTQGDWAGAAAARDELLALTDLINAATTRLDDLKMRGRFTVAFGADLGPTVPGATGPGQPPGPPPPPGRPFVPTDPRAQEALDQQRQKIDDVVASLRMEREQLGRTNQEQRFYEELARAGIDANHERAAEIREAVDALLAEEERLARINEIMDTAKSVTSDFFHTFQDGLLEGKTAIESLGDALDNLRQQLLRMALDRSIQMLFDALTSVATGGVGGGNFPILRAIFGRAGGGAVMGGRPYMVGERGPELFIPHSAGVIKPGANDNRGGGVSVQIINNTGSQVREERGRGPDGRSFVRFIIGEVGAAIGRGEMDGPLTRFGSRPRVRGRS